jgi:phytoene/squalene synthetase
MKRFGVTESTLALGKPTDDLRRLLRHEVDFARDLFKQGLPLISLVNRELALDLDLFSRGGLEILRAIEKQNYDVLSARPSISKVTKLQLALRAVTGKFLPFVRLGQAAVRKVRDLHNQWAAVRFQLSTCTIQISLLC